MRRLRLGDKLLRVRDEPEPAPNPARSAPPLFCVHGAGMSSVVWMDFLRRFAHQRGRRTIAPDLPGHGQSDSWHDAPSLAHYRDAVGTVCATLKVPKVVLVGHSMGAAIALSCAVSWPERVAGLVLLNGGARLEVPPEVMALLERELEKGPAGDRERVDKMPDAFADLAFSPATSADLRARWQAMLFAAERGVILGDFAACKGLDIRRELGRLGGSRIPALLISGSDDLLIPPELGAETSALLSDAGQDATHVVIAETGHLSHLERQEACYKEIEKFLSR